MHRGWGGGRRRATGRGGERGASPHFLAQADCFSQEEGEARDQQKDLSGERLGTRLAWPRAPWRNVSVAAWAG